MGVERIKSIEDAKFNQIKYQYIIVLGANIISYSHGFGVGWLSSALPTLKSQNTPLENGPLTLEETSWLGGSYPLGALVGDFLFAVLLKYMGRKKAMMLLAIPNSIFWLTVCLSKSYTELVIGRFIGGITGGGILVCMPLFVAEIANKQIRGFLGLMGPLSTAIGVLVSYICGAFIQYDFLPYCIMVFPVIFLIVMCVIPETPHSLIRQKNMQESLRTVRRVNWPRALKFFLSSTAYLKNKAEHSLNFYNNGNSKVENGYNVQDELNKLLILVSQKDDEKKKHSYTLLLQKESLKKLLIGISLVGLSMFSGIIVVTMYATQLFIDSGASFDPHISTIIVGVLQVCGIYVSSMLVDRIGRRILFGVSSFGAAISLILFGTFSFLNKKGADLSAVDWLPVSSASFYIFVNCVGMRPMPFLYITEILPYNVRQIGVTICMIAMSLFAFTSVFTLPILQKLYELHAVIWMYAVICLLGVLFSIFVMTETKGKNLNKVQEK